jgi:type IV secretory pathway component VirB8
MSDTEDMLLEPPDEQYAGLRDTAFTDVLAAHKAEQYYNRERSRAGWWVGGIGAAIGVLGILAATTVSIYARPVVRYTEIDDASGVIRASYGAEDAPDHFNDRVIKHYLAEYVGLRQRFVWALDPEIAHRVKIMSAPAEQVRYEADRSKDSPGARYGMNGYARVTKFVAFTQRAKGKDKTYEYDVQFTEGEVLAANPGAAIETHMTARVIFQFHPEITMNDQDRLQNESGMMVISYSATADSR